MFMTLKIYKNSVNPKIFAKYTIDENQNILLNNKNI